MATLKAGTTVGGSSVLTGATHNNTSDPHDQYKLKSELTAEYYTQATVDSLLAANSVADQAASAGFAAAAEVSATNAATSETNAATSASQAATSATNANTSAGNAATSEANAATSETNAGNSATAAASSATTAATSETNAASSASAAATSASNAAASETQTANYIATLAAGSISDVAPSATTTYSSNKIEELTAGLELTVNSDVTIGSPIALTSTGQVEPVSLTATSTLDTNDHPTSSSSPYWRADKVSESQFIVARNQDLYIADINTSTGVITWGTEFNRNRVITAIKYIGGSKFVTVEYFSSSIYVSLYSFSGGVITELDDTFITTGITNTSAGHSEIYESDTDEFVATYNNGSNQLDVLRFTLTTGRTVVSNTGPTAPNNNVNASRYRNGRGNTLFVNNKFLTFDIYSSNSTVTMQSSNWNGTSWDSFVSTTGTYTDTSGLTIYPFHSPMVDLGDNIVGQFVWAYRSSESLNYSLDFHKFDVSSNTYLGYTELFRSKYDVSSDEDSVGASLLQVDIINGRLIVTYPIYDNTDAVYVNRQYSYKYDSAAKAVVGSPIITDLTYASNIDSGNNYSLYFPIDNKILMWTNLSSGIDMELVTPATTNYTEFVGYPAVSEVAGQDVEVKALGSVATNLSGLTAGLFYKVGNDGVLSTSSMSEANLQAISATEAIVLTGGSYD